MPVKSGALIFQKNKFALQRNFERKNIPANLFLASMDDNPGIPENYFDLVVSIYSPGMDARFIPHARIGLCILEVWRNVHFQLGTSCIPVFAV